MLVPGTVLLPGTRGTNLIAGAGFSANGQCASIFSGRAGGASSDCKLHINSLELRVVILALRHWGSVLQGHQAMLATHNTTVL